MSAACKSCGASIIWALTQNGKRIPLDAEPAERPSGLFRLEGSATGSMPPIAISAAGEPVYLSHFVTCPNADQHRKPRASPADRESPSMERERLFHEAVDAE
jgi:hypothetical protein